MQTLDPTAALNATSAQIGALPGLTALASATNAATNADYRSSINQLLPGVQNTLATSENNANSLISGQIPADVQASLQRSDAFSALQGGFGQSSGMGRNLNARDLGLTSLNLQNQGESLLNQNLNMASALTPGRMNAQSMLFTPSQMLSVQGQNNQINYQNAQQQSPFDTMLQSAISTGVNGAVAGGMAYATGGMSLAGGMGGSGGGSSSAPASNGASSSFNSMYGSGFNPYSSSFNSSVSPTFGGFSPLSM